MPQGESRGNRGGDLRAGWLGSGAAPLGGHMLLGSNSADQKGLGLD